MIKTLYRCFDASGALLYVGVTKNLALRMQQHKASSDWFHLVAKFEFGETLPSKDALAAERHAIKAEKPKCNLVGSIAPEHDFLAVAKISSAISSGAKLDSNSLHGQEVLNFVRRIESIRSAPNTSKALERDVFEEARAAGYMTRALRTILKQRANIQAANLHSMSGFNACRTALGLA